MALRYKTVAGLVCAAQIMAASACAAPCWTALERSAYQVRGLQTMLMVAALKCNVMGGTAANDSYSRFIRVIRPALGASATVLNARFKRLFGTQATAAMDATVTRLANSFSSAPISDSACSEAAETADRAAAGSAAELAVLAAELVILPEDAELCGKQ